MKPTSQSVNPTVIEVNGLTKQYGDTTAVNKLSLSIKAGEIYGFLGLNGAGKTTTMRMLLGMIRPTAGDVKLFGESIHSRPGKVWPRVGYMVDVPSAYPDLTVRENLEITRRLYHLSDDKCVDTVMETLSIKQYAERRAGALSHGNSQRLGLAKAIMHKPELLLVDEPANGLDPAGIVEIREMLRSLSRDHGTTVFMSSHILDEVSRLATRIGIIHKGRLLEELSADDLQRHLQPRLLIDSRERDKARSILASAGFEVRYGDNGSLEIESKRAVERPDDIASLLVQAGTPPIMLQIKQEDLETHFLRMVEDSEVKI